MFINTINAAAIITTDAAIIIHLFPFLFLIKSSFKTIFFPYLEMKQSKSNRQVTKNSIVTYRLLVNMVDSPNQSLSNTESAISACSVLIILLSSSSRLCLNPPS